MTMKSNYTSGLSFDGDGRIVIWVEDLGGPFMSVTNNAEGVVQDVVKKYGDHPIVYKDSEGKWDQLQHKGGVFSRFRFIGVDNKDEAVRKAK